MSSLKIDTPTAVRQGEELDLLKLNDFIKSQLPYFEQIIEVSKAIDRLSSYLDAL